MSFGPSEQAMLAASQAASAEQRQSFQEALAFAKEQYNQQRQDRSPYMTAGQSALDMWVNLLGLTPGLVDNSGGGGLTGTLRSLSSTGASGGSGSSGGAGSSGSANAAGTATFAQKPFPQAPYTPAWRTPTVGNGDSAGYEARYPYYDWTLPTDGFDPTDTTGLPPFYPKR